MNINKFFKWVLGFSLLSFCMSPLAGVVVVGSVLLLWGITLLIVGSVYSKYKGKALESSRSKYSIFYRKEDNIIPIDDNGKQTTALGNFVMKETWGLPSRIDAITTEIDALLTTKSVIFVFLVEDEGFKTTDWDKQKQNIESVVGNSDAGFYSVVVNSGKSLVYRYLSEDSHELKEIEISNEQLKYLRQK